MTALDILKMGHPTLLKESQEIKIEKLISFEYQKFINDLIHTMRGANGAGIAAPQVNVLDRVFAMEMTDNPRYPDKETFPLIIAVNPEIEFIETEKIDSWEGCLSIPNIRGRLKRYKKIKLKGLNRVGEPFGIELEGFAAIVAQHELDHLDGKLFINRMESMDTLTFQKEYETYWDKI